MEKLLTHSLLRNEIETTSQYSITANLYAVSASAARCLLDLLAARKIDDNELQEESGRNGPKHLGNRQAACSAAELCRKDNNTAVFSTGG